MRMTTALALVWPVMLTGAALTTAIASDVRAAQPQAQQATVREPQTVAAVFQEFGLIGTWAVDCSQPAAPDNPHVRDMEVSPESVMERQDLGHNSRINTYDILKAKRLSKTELALEVIFEPGQNGEQHQHLVMRVEGGKRRTLFNQPVGRPVRVKDGMELAFGLKTPTLTKCE